MGGFDQELNWSDILSLGEQQRLAFARVLLARPSYALLDEATSALDVANELQFYDRLRQAGITYLSVGHRPTLAQYHTNVLALAEDNSWLLKQSPVRN
jgi:putative ATP-binding cassette transporter